MYFVNEVDDERFNPWLENFVNQVVRRSGFTGKGLQITIEKFTPDYEGNGVVYIRIKDKEYYIMADGFPDDFSVLSMDNLLINYVFTDDTLRLLKEGKIRVQCR